MSITLAKDLTDEDLVGKKYLTALVSAHHPEADDGSTVLLVDILTTPAPPMTPIPTFEKSIYRGQLNDDLTLSFGNIVIIPDTYMDDVVVNILGGNSSKKKKVRLFYQCFLFLDDSSFFTITGNRNILSISQRQVITEEDLETKDYLTFTVVATNENSGKSETNALIDIPRKICPGLIFFYNTTWNFLIVFFNLECPTTTTPEPSTCPPPVTCPEPPTTTPCPTPEPCPDCPTPAPPVIDLTPQFENKIYNFWIKSSDTGQIGEVFAEVDSPNEIEVVYSLDISDGKCNASKKIQALTLIILLITT